MRGESLQSLGDGRVWITQANQLLEYRDNFESLGCVWRRGVSLAVKLHKTTGAICRAHFSSVTFDDPDLQGQILELFAQQIKEFRRGLFESVDVEALRVLLHRFKGSARGVGAFALGEALEQAEQEAASGTLPVLTSVEVCLAEVSADLSELQNS